MDQRPPPSTEELVQKAYNHFFLSHTSFSQLKDAALKGRLHNNPISSNGVAGRSIAWKLFLAKHEPLQSSSSPRASNLLEWLRGSRGQYTTLMLEKTRAPDGSYDQTSRISRGTQETTSTENLDLNNPLSLHDENPWNEWFASVELRKTILQDVERTFPDIPFFRDHQVQESLANVLFIYSVTHPDIGYRQGMHELLAPLFYAISFDSISQDGDAATATAVVRELCSRNWIAADAWTLFEAVMQGVSRWYEWQEPALSRNKSDPPTVSQIHITDGQNGMQLYLAPIVQACNYIQSTLLKASDPMLWKHLQSAGIEPQIYGIRWLRLLFTREFTMPDAMMLWDGLFAADPTLALCQWVCVAMLIRIRNELIPGDYSAQLTALLHYPPPPESKLDGAPNHTSLLLQQALSLQMAPSPSTGASLMMENRTLLDIPLEVPTATFQQSPRRQADKSHPSSASNIRSGVELDHFLNHARHASSPSLGIPEMIARGLLERGESLGINKTLMSAVSEIRRNIPDLAASLGRPPNQSLSSFPLEEDRPTERPPSEPRTRFETERGLTQLRARDQRLGQSLGWIVDALLQDESGVRDAQQLKRQKREALESLSYVRDVLMNNILSLDPDMLIGEEEASKRQQRRKRDQDLRSQSSESVAIVSVPVPVPVIDSHRKASNDGYLNTQSRPLSLPPNTQVSAVRRPPPWDHTLSNFNNPPVNVFSSPLPRRPPPTSTGLRRVNVAERTTDQTKVSHATDGYHDPLGALRG